MSERITPVDIADRMEGAFLDYAMSVIVSRALPDVRDGLKPVQRRILYAMYEANLHADRPHRKCASVVGDVMKKYHPHGDSSIYEALVRMAQDFSTREPLIDGRGNFGSVDGDPAAAFRYTESRLSPLAMHMLADIDDDTVNYSPNYDGHEMAPDILPARFPNLLVNGATGIAVGFSTNIAPHNLVETIEACKVLIANPLATLDEVMEVLPAPDFPTGGRIVPTEGIREAFETGKGAITMEAVASTEVRSGAMPRIVVTEIPYQVNKATLLLKIADLVKAKKLDAIRDLRDESSRDGMRIVIELKRGEDVQATLTQLFTLTDLRTNFNVNMVALKDGKPQLLPLLDIIHAYIAHQRDVLTRRTQYRLNVAQQRLHIIDGLLMALDAIDEVIALIRASRSTPEARTNLMEHLGLSEVQANAVLEMQLRRLAMLEHDKLTQEQAKLAELVAQYQAILADPAALDALLVHELDAMAADHGNPRRSRLGDEATAASTVPILAAQEVTTYIYADGTIKPVAKKAYSDAMTDSGELVAVVSGPADATMLCIDAQGGGHVVAPDSIGVLTPKQRGVSLASLGYSVNAPLVGAVRLPAPDSTDTIITISEQGYCKRTAVSEFDVRNRSMVAGSTRAGDSIMHVLVSHHDDDLMMLASSHGQAIVFPVRDIRPVRRQAIGVAGMRLSSGATVVAVTCWSQEDRDRDVVVIARNGAIKRVPVGAFPIQARNGKGVLTGVGSLVFAGVSEHVHIPVSLSEEGLAAKGTQVVRTTGLPVMVRSKTPDPQQGLGGPVQAGKAVPE